MSDMDGVIERLEEGRNKLGGFGEPVWSASIMAVQQLEAERDRLREALERIEQQQPRVLGYIWREGFVFDGNLADYEGWKKLAFSIYSDLCEVDSIARAALQASSPKEPE